MQQNGKINASSYSSYMKFMWKSLNPVKAIEIYNGIHDESAKNNVFICNSVLSCLVRNGKFERSIKLFHQMKMDGLMPDVVTYSTVGYDDNMLLYRTLITIKEYFRLSILHVITCLDTFANRKFCRKSSELVHFCYRTNCRS